MGCVAGRGGAAWLGMKVGVLDVGRDSSFVRKNKATQKMGAKGVCMLWVVISGR